MAVRVRPSKKRIFAGAPQPKSLLYVRARCALYIAMSSGAANSKPSQLNCEQVAPGRLLDLGIPTFLCPTPRWRNGDACTTRVLRRFLPDAYTDTESLFRR